MITAENDLAKLNGILKDIEIHPDRYDEAERRYKRIGEWLDREGSRIKQYHPRVYPQGSFRLGTAIKPISGGGGFDVDLVCELNLDRSTLSQLQLKSLIGEEIRQFMNENGFKEPIEEGRRCWTIKYSDGSSFHMDVLPAISDSERFRARLVEAGYKEFSGSDYNETAISITDSESASYAVVSNDWAQSNPIGYSKWFYGQTRKTIDSMRKAMMKVEATVEEIPKHKVNAPLQQAVKILKRHRDALFNGRDEIKPISIIITTLAARIYNGESLLSDIVYKFAMEADKHINVSGGVYCIENPVNPLENFADKWASHPERKDAFYDWINQLRADLASMSIDESLLRGGKRVSLASVFAASNVQSSSSMLPALFRPPLPVLAINVPHRRSIRCPVELDPNAEVSLRCYIQEGYGTKRSIGENATVRKDTQLIFEAEIRGDWSPDQVEWQVVNTGSEARDQSCLRGGFYAPDFNNGRKFRRKEYAKYTGVHCVECLFYKNGKVAARTGDFLIKIQ